MELSIYCQGFTSWVKLGFISNIKMLPVNSIAMNLRNTLHSSIWTHGAQYLLPRVYLVGEVRFHIEYKNVARNTKL